MCTHQLKNSHRFIQSNLITIFHLKGAEKLHKYVTGARKAKAIKTFEQMRGESKLLTCAFLSALARNTRKQNKFHLINELCAKPQSSAFRSENALAFCCVLLRAHEKFTC